MPWPGFVSGGQLPRTNYASQPGAGSSVQQANEKKRNRQRQRNRNPNTQGQHKVYSKTDTQQDDYDDVNVDDFVEQLMKGAPSKQFSQVAGSRGLPASETMFQTMGSYNPHRVDPQIPMHGNDEQEYYDEYDDDDNAPNPGEIQARDPYQAKLEQVHESVDSFQSWREAFQNRDGRQVQSRAQSSVHQQQIASPSKQSTVGSGARASWNTLEENPWDFHAHSEGPGKVQTGQVRQNLGYQNQRQKPRKDFSNDTDFRGMEPAGSNTGQKIHGNNPASFTAHEEDVESSWDYLSQYEQRGRVQARTARQNIGYQQQRGNVIANTEEDTDFRNMGQEDNGSSLEYPTHDERPLRFQARNSGQSRQALGNQQQREMASRYIEQDTDDRNVGQIVSKTRQVDVTKSKEDIGKSWDYLTRKVESGNRSSESSSHQMQRQRNIQQNVADRSEARRSQMDNQQGAKRNVNSKAWGYVSDVDQIEREGYPQIDHQTFDYDHQPSGTVFSRQDYFEAGKARDSFEKSHQHQFDQRDDYRFETPMINTNKESRRVAQSGSPNKRQKINEFEGKMDVDKHTAQRGYGHSRPLQMGSYEPEQRGLYSPGMKYDRHQGGSWFEEQDCPDRGRQQKTDERASLLQQRGSRFDKQDYPERGRQQKTDERASFRQQGRSRFEEQDYPDRGRQQKTDERASFRQQGGSRFEEQDYSERGRQEKTDERASFLQQRGSRFEEQDYPDRGRQQKTDERASFRQQVSREESTVVKQTWSDPDVVVHPPRQTRPGVLMPKFVVKFLKGAGKYIVGLHQSLKMYRLPGNCIGLVPAKMNTESWDKLPKHVRKRDDMLQQCHRWVAFGTIPLLQLIDTFGKDLQMEKDVPRFTTDSLNLLMFALNNLSIKRRLFMRDFLNREFKILCRKEQAISRNLFGDKIQDDLSLVQRGMFQISEKEKNSVEVNTDDPDAPSYKPMFFAGLAIHGKEIDKSVGNTVNMACSNDGSVMDLRMKHRIPSNCAELTTPKLNLEISRLLPRLAMEFDYRLQDVQTALSESMVPAMHILKSVEDKQYVEGDVLSLLTDSVLLLCNTLYLLTRMRMNHVKTFLPKRASSSCQFVWPSSHGEQMVFNDQ